MTAAAACPCCGRQLDVREFRGLNIMHGDAPLLMGACPCRSHRSVLAGDVTCDDVGVHRTVELLSDGRLCSAADLAEAVEDAGMNRSARRRRVPRLKRAA